MARVLLPCFLSACALLSFAPHARAHDDDGKLRDRRPRMEASHFSPTGTLALSSDSFMFPASGVQLMSWVPLRDFSVGTESGNSCTGYTAPSGREYAIIGLSTGTGFVEITDPGNPTIVSLLPGNESLWRDMRVYQHWCYIVSENQQGIQVVDLAQIDSGIVTLVTEVDTGGNLATHTLTLNAQSGYLYRAGGAGNGLRIYSLANPAAPTYVAAWPDRYVHEATVVSYTSGTYAGREIAFCCGGFNNGFDQTGLDIVDVTNKSNIFLIKRFFYSNAAYSHQGWLSSDKKYFYLDDEKDETGSNPTSTRIINVQNLSNPSEVGTFGNGLMSIDHNQYVLGNRIYQSNYTTGLRIFDNTNATAPVQIAWFDTFPENDSAHFNGLWNNYPYFPSGTVIGSDLEKGLFVWFVGAPTVAIGFPSGVPDAIDPVAGTLHLTLSSASLMPNSGKLHYDIGAGFTTVDLVATGGTGYDAHFPALTCGQDIAWYVSARSSNGFTWTYPQGAPTIVAHSTAAAASTLVLIDTMETPDNWIVGGPGDTVNSGFWQRGDPAGTAAQSEDDHTPGNGINCWVTGKGQAVLGLGADDVDGGKTTLRTQQYFMLGMDTPVVRYWRWYSTNLGPLPHDEDVFVVEISNDLGANWINVETIGPGGAEAAGGWILHQFKVSDFVQPNEHVQLRFIASDFNNPSNVEAAIDDFAVLDIGCPASAPSIYCTAKINSQGCTPAIAFNGTPSASSGQPFTIDASLVINNKAGLLLYALGQANTPFQGGTLCLTQPFKRTPIQDSLGNPPPGDCSGTYSFDFNAFIAAGSDPALIAGTSIDAQYYYRDPLDPAGFGSGLTDAVEFTIAP